MFILAQMGFETSKRYFGGFQVLGSEILTQNVGENGGSIILGCGLKKILGTNEMCYITYVLPELVVHKNCNT